MKSDVRDGPTCGARLTRFTAGSFVVPRHYLALLLGTPAAERLIARSNATGIAMPENAGGMPSVAFLKLCLEYMRTTGDESYGSADKPVPKGTLGILMAAAAQGENFADALKRFASAAAMLRPDITLKYSRSRRGVAIALSYEGKRSARKELLIEIFTLSLHCAFRWLTGRSLRPLQVRLAEPRDEFQKTVLRGVLGCPAIRKGSGVVLTYRPADAPTPLAQVKYNTWAAHEFGEFMRMLEEAAASRNANAVEPAPAIVRDVRAAIADGLHSETRVSRRLKMSPATLRRRLSDAGTCFRAVLDEVQRGRAAALLMTDKPFEEIATEVRYSDARSFRRACQRWFGMTPRDYRRGLASQPPPR